MNVQEQLLQERVDPGLSNSALTEAARRALAAIGDGPDTDAQHGAPIVRGYHVLTGGCWNRVIGIEAAGRGLVCKISPHPNDEKIIREFSVLTAFAERSHLPIPQPLYLDAEGEVFPGTSFVMTRVPGAVMHECFGMLNYGQRRGITRQIADDLASLHQIRSRGFGGVELEEDERDERWADFWLPRFDRTIEEASAAGVPAQLIEGAHEVRPHLEGFLEIGTESTMTHYDIWSGNVMLDVESDPPRVSGYIDIPGFFADYARELSFAMLFGVANRRFFETYLQTHELDEGFAVRANIYNLKMNIRHVQMYPMEYGYQAGALQNLEAIRDAIAAT
jgi:fructosamine-3-kinase